MDSVVDEIGCFCFLSSLHRPDTVLKYRPDCRLLRPFLLSAGNRAFPPFPMNLSETNASSLLYMRLQDNPFPFFFFPIAPDL